MRSSGTGGGGRKVDAEVGPTPLTLVSFRKIFRRRKRSQKLEGVLSDVACGMSDTSNTLLAGEQLVKSGDGDNHVVTGLLFLQTDLVGN